MLSDAGGLQSLDLTITYDKNVFSLPTNGNVITAGSLTSGKAPFVVNSSQPGQLKISWSGTSSLNNGNGSIAMLNLETKTDATLGVTKIDLVSASINEGGIAVSLDDGDLTILPPSFQVLGVRELPNGLALKLSEAPNLDTFNLYDGLDASQDSPDLRLTDGAGKAVALSAHWQASSQELFLLSSAPLAAGGYTLAIDSRSDGLVSASKGESLDGNGDGTSGDAFSYNYTHQKSGYSLSIGDTARGAGQELSINGTGHFDPVTGIALTAAKGLPVHLTTAKALTSLSGTFKLDSQLLLNSQWVAGADLPDDWTISVNSTGQTGEYQFQASGNTSIEGSNLEIFRLKGNVTANAAPGNNGIYGSTTLIEATIKSDQLTGQVFTVDPGLVALAYSGDATGNGTLSSLDASYVQRVVVELDSGFDAYDDLNPVLISDTTGNGTLSSLDASRIQQQVVGLPVDSFPPMTN